MRMSAMPAWTRTSGGPWPSTLYASVAPSTSAVGITPCLRSHGRSLPEPVGPVVAQLVRGADDRAHRDEGEAAADRDAGDTRLGKLRDRRRRRQREHVHGPVDLGHDAANVVDPRQPRRVEDV